MNDRRVSAVLLLVLVWALTAVPAQPASTPTVPDDAASPSLETALAAAASPATGAHSGGSNTAKTPPQETTQQAPQFRAGVSRVRVDVVVTDDDGEFVGDLRPEDFAIYEDGQPQQILQVQLVDLIAGQVRTIGGEEAGVASENPVASTPELGPPERGPGEPTIEPGDYGAMIFVIQTGRLGYWERRRFARAWVNLVEQTAEYSFPRAVFAIGYRGRLRQLTPLTYDVDVLRDVSAQFLDAVRGRESRIASETRDEDDPASGEASRQGRPAPADDMPGRAAALEFSYLHFVFEEDVGALDTLDALTRICDALYERPGRKAIVWVSEGVLLMPDGRSVDAVEKLQRAANTARTSIYTVDPALWTKRSGGGWGGAASRIGPADLALADSGRGSNANDFRDSLVVTARETGGKSYIFNPRVEPALRDIERDSSRFYLLTYRPPRDEGDDEYHEIEVELRRRDLDVRARSGYTHYSRMERESFLAGTASQLTELPVTAGAFYRWDYDGKPRVQVGVDIDRLEAALGRASDAAATSQAGAHTLELYFMALDEEGDFIDHVRERVTRRVAGIGNRPSVYLRDWELGLGLINIYVMVFDASSGRQGRSWFQIRIPNPVTSWRASKPIFARKNSTGALDPILDGTATEGTPIQVCLEVFGAHGPVLWARVVDEDHGVQRQLFSAELTPNAESGIAVAFLNLPSRLPPGSYTIQLSISDPMVRGAANFDLPLEIVPREPPLPEQERPL